MSTLPAHLTVTRNGNHTDVDCARCGFGITVGARFGPIPGDVLVQQFVTDHAHPRTAVGRPRPAPLPDGTERITGL